MNNRHSSTRMCTPQQQGASQHGDHSAHAGAGDRGHGRAWRPRDRPERLASADQRGPEGCRLSVHRHLGRRELFHLPVRAPTPPPRALPTTLLPELPFLEPNPVMRRHRPCIRQARAPEHVGRFPREGHVSR